MFHKLANTTARRLRRQRFSQARYEGAVDRLVAAYVDWREEFITARDAYSRYDGTRGQEHRHAFAAYFAALDREERAAAEYAACVDQVYALVSADRGLLMAARSGAGSAPALSQRPQRRV
jgi:hypothetical protein